MSSSDSETERAWLGDMSSADKPLEESDSSMRKRLVDSLSQSFPGSALSKALHLMEADQVDGDPLSSSCFAEIRLDKGAINEDDDLTSLTWLQDSDILKNIAKDEDVNTEGQKENGLDVKSDVVTPHHPPHVPYNPLKHVNSKPPYSFSCLIFMAVEDSPNKRLPVKDIYNWILTHFPYFQNAPTGWKNSVRHNLSLNKCFRKVDKDKGHSIGKGSLWCIDPDYRPNLLQALRKTPYHPYHQLQMLANNTSAPQHFGLPRPTPLVQRINFNTPSPHLFPFLSKRLAQSKLEPDSPHSDIDVANALVSLKGGAFRPPESSRLRPLHIMHGHGQYNGTRRRSPSPPEYGSEAYRKRKLKISPEAPLAPSAVVCTRSPSEDHTYSVPHKRRRPRSVSSDDLDEDLEDEHGLLSDVEELTDSSYHSSSAEEDLEEEVADDEDDNRELHERHRELELPVKKRYRSRLIFDDEDAKVAEGANALLNLAGIKTSHIVPLRAISPMNNNSLIMKRQVIV